MKIIEKSVLSSNKIHLLKGKVYLPDGEIKGYYQIVHGMTEHIVRYHEFMQALAENGYIAFGYDQLGHGLTAEPSGDLGYIAPKNGFNLLVQDVAVFYNAMVDEYGKHPYFLMGHSMGSFIVRLAITQTVKPDKAIIMGTGGKNPLADIALTLIKVMKLFKGERHVSKTLDKMAFGSYNNDFKAENNRRSWLTTDRAIWEKYDNDKFCNYRFTLSAMHDLISLNKLSNLNSWYDNVPNDLPLLLVSGDCEPVGENGKAVTKVYETLVKKGKNATIKLYNGARHEILNDFCKAEVYADILNFIK